MTIDISYLKENHKVFQNTYNKFKNIGINDLDSNQKATFALLGISPILKEALQDSLIVNFAKNYTISKNIIYKILFEEMGLEKHKELRTINLILKSAYNYDLIENVELWVKYKDLRNIIAEKIRLEDELEALDYVESFLKDQEILIKNIEELIEQNAI